jgi:hypothetical protein
LCASYDFNASRFANFNPVQPPRGGQTGGAQQSLCPPGMAVTAFKLFLHPDPEFHKHNSPNYHASPLYLRGVLATCGVPAAPSGGQFCFGQCSDADTGTFLGSELPKLKTYSQNCAAEGMMMTGINIRAGSYVDAMGGFCGANPTPPVAAAPPPAPPPKPIKTTGKAKGGAASGPSAPPGLLVCHTGGNMKPFGTPSGSGSMLLTFEAAPQAASVALPGPGQCAWDIVPVTASQPKRVGLNAGMMAQIGDIQSDTIFKVHASTMSAFLFATGDVEILSGGVAAAGGEVGAGEAEGGGDVGEAGGGGMAGGPGVPSGDCPAGTATVQTPAGLDFLNVRDGPSSGATVVAQVPNGSEVTVSGGCFKAAAGLTQQKVKIPVGGWCRIEAPDQGCVKAEFLAFAGDMGGDVPIDPGKGAGLAKQTLAPKPAGKGGGTFSGQWNVTDDDNVAYSMNLVQAGSGVTGQFKGADGSRGTLVGKVNGNTLRFAWVQTNDGQKGSGKFVLAGDGGSFSGSYNFQVGNFDKVEGQWNGQRR